MITKKTCAEAYYKVLATGLVKGVQMEVYKALSECDPLTQREVAKYLNRVITSVSPRFAELAHNGLIQVASVRKCSVTNMTVETWTTTDKVPAAKLSRPEGELTRLRREVIDQDAYIKRLEACLSPSQIANAITNTGVVKYVKVLAEMCSHCGGTGDDSYFNGKCPHCKGSGEKSK